MPELTDITKTMINIADQTFEFQTLEAGVKPFPKRATFMEAWNDMFLHVNAAVESGEKLSWQWLESCIWIEVKEPGNKYPILFPNARDKAIREFGWKKP